MSQVHRNKREQITTQQTEEPIFITLDQANHPYTHAITTVLLASFTSSNTDCEDELLYVLDTAGRVINL